MSASQPLISQALRRAIECCRMLFDAEMSDELPDATPTPKALKLRTEATEYQKLLNKLEPKRRGTTKRNTPS